jgi:membrane protein implicated in regulation of membrane protease activity
VIVGDVVPPEVSVAQSLAWIRPRRAAPVQAVEHAAAEGAPVVSRGAAAPAGGAGRPKWLVAAALLVVLAIFLVWGLNRITDRRLQERAAADSAARAMAERVRVTDSIARERRDSIVADSVSRAEAGGAAVDSFPVYSPANPQDVGSAVGYAVLLSRYNVKSSAILELNSRFARLPAATYGIESPSRFYLNIAGAFATRAGADSLLAQLRARRTLGLGFGSVDNFPLAFLVDSAVPIRDATPRLARYAARGLPVYGLRQPNGKLRLYWGAYTNPEQAALAVPGVREAGIRPMLVYRIGRVF